MMKEMTHIDMQMHNTYIVTVCFCFLLNCQLYFCVFIIPASTTEINVAIVSGGQIFSVMGH